MLFPVNCILAQLYMWFSVPPLGTILWPRAATQPSERWSWEGWSYGGEAKEEAKEQGSLWKWRVNSKMSDLRMLGFITSVSTWILISHLHGEKQSWAVSTPRSLFLLPWLEKSAFYRKPWHSHSWRWMLYKAAVWYHTWNVRDSHCTASTCNRTGAWDMERAPSSWILYGNCIFVLFR